MAEEPLLYFNGIDGVSGDYSRPPVAIDSFSEMVLKYEIEPEEAKFLRFLGERNSNVSFAPPTFLDYEDLSQAGWGVIFPEDIHPDIRTALRPLLQLRQEQVGVLYKELDYRSGESFFRWTARYNASTGEVDPQRIPYYLLLAGTPEQIPFNFQTLLSVQYAVGRIAFDRLEEYSNYAQSVVNAEQQQLRLARRAAVFAPANPDDRHTALTSRLLAEPLAKELQGAQRKGQSGWDISTAIADSAIKTAFADLLGGPQAPALFFAAAHGKIYPSGHVYQASHQGALLCQDWPGPQAYRGDISRNFSFSADDLPTDASLWGTVAFLYGSFSAGVPRLDGFARQVHQTDVPYTPHSFVARLPQRMLSHPRGGALAVIGLAERAWGFSFDFGNVENKNRSMRLELQDFLSRLMQGGTVGEAIVNFRARYAELAQEWQTLQRDSKFMPADPYSVVDLWTALQDFQNLIVLGDPAVRLLVAPEDAQAAPERISLDLRSPVTAVEAEDFSVAKAAPVPSAISRLIQMPRFETDNPARPKDLIGVEGHVNAFARLIASCRTTPPLAIGLFGEWGSGKTFFMKQLQREVNRLSKVMRASGQMQVRLPFYKHIVQIEFNAWHYIEGNIWASLAEHIIKNLAGDEDTPNEDMIRLLQQKLAVEQSVRAEAERHVSEAEGRVQQAQTALVEAQGRSTGKEIEKQLVQGIRENVEKDFRAQVNRLLQDLGLEELPEKSQEYRQKLEEARARAEQARGWLEIMRKEKAVRQNRLLIAAAALITAVAALFIWLFFSALDLDALARLLAPLSGLAALAGSTAAWLREKMRQAQPLVDSASRLLQDYNTRVQQVISENDEKLKALEQELESVKTEMKQKEQTLQAAQAAEQQAKEKLEQATPARLLAGFLSDRAQSSDYRKHLGLLALIHRDFKTLSEMMEEANWQLAPDDLDSADEKAPARLVKKFASLAEEEADQARRVNRIVLYIDDLDRCPPEKVVEVLQAVHLLLAFPLFVVVVGVDARWIKESLKVRYRQMLHLESGGAETAHYEENNIFGRATPEDYLEKIFQVPFWLKPMDEKASWNMIEGLLGPLDAGPSFGLNLPMPNSWVETPAARFVETFSVEPAVPSNGGAQEPEALSFGLSNAAPEPLSFGLPDSDFAPANTATAEGQNPESEGQPEAMDATVPGRVSFSSAPQPVAEESFGIASPSLRTRTPEEEQEELKQQAAELAKSARVMDVGSEEKRFMQLLTPLLGRSPRALKRFLNIYRLIKASLPEDEADTFTQARPGGVIAPFEAVLFLLAIDTGLPELARPLFDLLDDAGFTKPIPDPKKGQEHLSTVELQLAQIRERLQLEALNGSDPDDPRQKLRQWLAGKKDYQSATFLLNAPDLEPLTTWAGVVNRYSFQSYHALAENK